MERKVRRRGSEVRWAKWVDDELRSEPTTRERMVSMHRSTRSHRSIAHLLAMQTFLSNRLLRCIHTHAIELVLTSHPPTPQHQAQGTITRSTSMNT